MRFWTTKFIVTFVFAATFAVGAFWHPMDPYTQRRPHVFPFAESGPAPFVFLLALLYVISHAGGWVFAHLRKRQPDERHSAAKRN